VLPVISARTSATVRVGSIDSSNAAAAATCGVAGLVPVRPSSASPLRPSVDDTVLVGVVAPNRPVDQMTNALSLDVSGGLICSSTDGRPPPGALTATSGPTFE
jgi:hypothetical protein